MAIRLADITWTHVLAGVGTATDSGAGAAKLRIYTGEPPTSPSQFSTSETLLVEFTLQDPAWTMVGDVLTLNTGTGGLAQVAVGDGEPGWGRIVTSDDDPVLDGLIGTDFVINMTSILSGQTVVLTAGSITKP